MGNVTHDFWIEVVSTDTTLPSIAFCLCYWSHCRPMFTKQTVVWLRTAEFRLGQQRKPGVPTGLCKVCNHPDVGRINFLLIATKGELGGGRKSLSERFGLSEASLHRHRHNHIPADYKSAIPSRWRLADRVRSGCGAEADRGRRQ